MAAEFKQYNISVNALWPRTAIATAAVQNHLGGDESIRRSRKDTIMADSAHLILTSKPTEITGQFIIVG
jgi:citronellol/citronellal dehydrogenase